MLSGASWHKYMPHHKTAEYGTVGRKVMMYVAGMSDVIIVKWVRTGRHYASITRLPHDIIIWKLSQTQHTARLYKFSSVLFFVIRYPTVRSLLAVIESLAISPSG